MPHSCPAATSRASSLKRLSCESLPSWITTLSRSSRTLAPRSTLPSVTRQPAMLPTFDTLKISRICALPSSVSRIDGASRPDIRLGDAADAGMQHARRHLVGAELVECSGDSFIRALNVGLDDQREVLA